MAYDHLSLVSPDVLEEVCHDLGSYVPNQLVVTL